MDGTWYYEYIIKIWNEIDKKEESRSGVVPAESMAEVMEQLEDYYGIKEIIEIQMLKPIIDGTVFEFQLAMEDTDFDYVISRKK